MPRPRSSHPRPGGPVDPLPRADLAGSGSASGTFTADRLVSFQFYGCCGEGVPDFRCGALAKLEVTLTPDVDPCLYFPAILWIDCLIGDKILVGRGAGQA